MCAVLQIFPNEKKINLDVKKHSYGFSYQGQEVFLLLPPLRRNVLLAKELEV